jgi:hypothetical protein
MGLLSTTIREYKVGAQKAPPRENMMKSNISHVDIYLFYWKHEIGYI